jgi:hypothetical protein
MNYLLLLKAFFLAVQVAKSQFCSEISDLLSSLFIGNEKTYCTL